METSKLRRQKPKYSQTLQTQSTARTYSPLTKKSQDHGTNNAIPSPKIPFLPPKVHGFLSKCSPFLHFPASHPIRKPKSHRRPIDSEENPRQFGIFPLLIPSPLSDPKNSCTDSEGIASFSGGGEIPPNSKQNRSERKDREDYLHTIPPALPPLSLSLSPSQIYRDIPFSYSLTHTPTLSPHKILGFT